MATHAAAPARSLYDEFLALFSNVLFAVSLFAVWGVLTLIGVVVDQGKDAAAYWNEYPAPVARLILRLHLDNIYHSPAYVGIIGLILVSLAVCTFKRVIPARLPPLRTVKIDAIPLNASIDVHGEEGAVRARIADFFASRGWQVRKREFGGEEWMFADRHNWARRGVLVAHIGFVIIAMGTTIYWWKGFQGTTAILTGQTITVPETGARIRLERFGYRFDPVQTKSGLVYQPIDYVSNVTVTGKDGVARQATIRVNDPLDVDGTLYYQATYGYGISFSLTKDGVPVPNAPNGPLKEGAGFQVADTPRAIQYTRFIGTIDRATGQPGADPRPNNPAVVLSAFDGDQPLGDILVPLGKSIDLGGGYKLTPAHYTLYSGLQYRYDPGVPLVGIGAFVLLSGLCIAFYLLPARLYVRITGTGRDWHVGLAATTVKGYDIFEEQFHDLVTALVSGPLGECRLHTNAEGPDSAGAPRSGGRAGWAGAP
ncbi:MAG TPA: cytochrome c biogenesis protein ResB [Candidatus Binatia bacterium]|nr:cytochrome c biogenesis protein ResB [Candidatus Binatia bacterium]